jgi:hypothetical protein
VALAAELKVNRFHGVRQHPNPPLRSLGRLFQAPAFDFLIVSTQRVFPSKRPPTVALPSMYCRISSSLS